MPQKVPKIMLGWEQNMLNVRKYSTAQSCHADPLSYLCLRGKSVELLHRNTQRKWPKKQGQSTPVHIFANYRDGLKSSKPHTACSNKVMKVLL